MNIEIKLGWYLIPLAVTIISFIVANNYTYRGSSGYAAIDLEGVVRNAIALIISLIAWLTYALIF